MGNAEGTIRKQQETHAMTEYKVIEVTRTRDLQEKIDEMATDGWALQMPFTFYESKHQNSNGVWVPAQHYILMFSRPAGTLPLVMVLLDLYERSKEMVQSGNKPRTNFDKMLTFVYNEVEKQVKKEQKLDDELADNPEEADEPGE